MNKYATLFLGTFAAGVAQFGMLYGMLDSPMRTVIAGTMVTAGTTLAGLLTKLPREEWTDEQRKEKA